MFQCPVWLKRCLLVSYLRSHFYLKSQLRGAGRHTAADSWGAGTVRGSLEKWIPVRRPWGRMWEGLSAEGSASELAHPGLPSPSHARDGARHDGAHQWIRLSEPNYSRTRAGFAECLLCLLIIYISTSFLLHTCAHACTFHLYLRLWHCDLYPPVIHLGSFWLTDCLWRPGRCLLWASVGTGQNSLKPKKVLRVFGREGREHPLPNYQENICPRHQKGIHTCLFPFSFPGEK